VVARRRSARRFGVVAAWLSVAVPLVGGLAPAAGAAVTDGGPSGSDLTAEAGFPMTMPVTGMVESLVGGGCPSGRAHSGVDVSSPLGTAAEVRAAYPGIATAFGAGDGYGIYVDIVHPFPGGQYVSRYAHLSQALVPPNGQPVEQGDVIGMMGSTGNAQIVHLHFEVRGPGGGVVDLNPAFRPCRREVLAGAPLTVSMLPLAPPVSTDPVFDELTVGLDGAFQAGWLSAPTPPADPQCRYWSRATNRSQANRCADDDDDGSGRRRARVAGSGGGS
jgi:murein DD-endopeptidase MepM/ murein hydrolase activator NlpD